MYIKHSLPFFSVLTFSWRVIPVVSSWAALLTAAHMLLGWKWVQMPPMPIRVLGTAVAFYLGFKGSACSSRCSTPTNAPRS